LAAGAAARTLLKVKPVTALLCMNWMLALGAMAVAGALLRALQRLEGVGPRARQSDHPI
jgi:DNA-binding LacI/PurR family transcriptional regulator